LVENRDLFILPSTQLPRGRQLRISSCCCFHNRAIFLIYQAVNCFSKYSCLCTVHARYRQTRQTDRRKSDVNSGAFTTQNSLKVTHFLTLFWEIVGYAYVYVIASLRNLTKLLYVEPGHYTEMMGIRSRAYGLANGIYQKPRLTQPGNRPGKLVGQLAIAAAIVRENSEQFRPCHQEEWPIHNDIMAKLLKSIVCYMNQKRRDTSPHILPSFSHFTTVVTPQTIPAVQL